MAFDPKKYKFAVLAVDTVLFAVRQGELKVLLMKIDRPPFFVGEWWGLPGGLIRPDETADQAVVRHLKEKVGARFKYMEQLYTFSRIDRDPRGRVVSVAYLALTPSIEVDSNKQKEITWASVKRLPRLAYDHKEVIKTAVERLAAKLEYTNVAFGLLPEEFTLGELQKLYEIALSRRMDKRNFRKKIFSLKLLKDLKKKKQTGRSRPATLYRFLETRPKIVEIL